MSYSIQCTHCKAVLKSAAPVPAGKKVKCPKCEQAFVTPDQDAEESKSHSVQCARCSAVLKSATPVPAAKTLTCPKCGKSFATPDAAPPVKPVLQPPPAAPPVPASLNISIFTGDGDAAIAKLMDESSPSKPASLDDDLVTEEDELVEPDEPASKRTP